MNKVLINLLSYVDYLKYKNTLDIWNYSSEEQKLLDDLQKAILVELHIKEVKEPEE